MRIDLAGRKRAPRAQREFPAPLLRLPPIANPYFIVWYGAPSPSVRGFDRLLAFRTQTVETLASDPQWQLGRGVWPFGWSWGTQGPQKSAEEFYDYIVRLIDKGAYGVCFDEWVGIDTAEDVQAYFRGGLPDGVREHAERFWKKSRGNPRNLMLAEACRRIKEKYSPFFIVACTHMQSAALIHALRQGWVDLAIVEAYTYVPGEPDWTPELAHWRLNNAKKAGVLEKTIPAFYVSTQTDKRGFRMMPDTVEKEIQYYRREFPQMPGICFYCPASAVRTPDPAQRSLLRACDRLAAKYYLDPAPKVRIVAPTDGAIVRSPVRIVAKADKPVKTWRLCVGAKHVCDQPGNAFVVTDLPPRPERHHRAGDHARLPARREADRGGSPRERPNRRGVAPVTWRARVSAHLPRRGASKTAGGMRPRCASGHLRSALLVQSGPLVRRASAAGFVLPPWPNAATISATSAASKRRETNWRDGRRNSRNLCQSNASRRKTQ